MTRAVYFSFPQDRSNLQPDTGTDHLVKSTTLLLHLLLHCLRLELLKILNLIENYQYYNLVETVRTTKQVTNVMLRLFLFL